MVCVTSFGILGPYFFKEKNVTVTVTFERYEEMLNNFLSAELQRLGVHDHDLWFQQDGATSHTARISMAVLRKMFPNRVISRSGDIDWQPRSPDFTSPDFFLGVFFKSKVFTNKPHTQLESKENIRREITTIDVHILQIVMDSMKKRIADCIQNEGGHLSNVIFESYDFCK